ncbi:hypothetical protein K438DRAFT_652863 [Mycena galopus ATCC 62051]|nr:hypothetical protein K438DRAFT_652863 [Mycena galopus ATCC 62051]
MGRRGVGHIYAKLTVLTLAAVVFPLVTPRVYQPVNHKESHAPPIPEQFASPLSRLLFDMLPLLADGDESTFCRRGVSRYLQRGDERRAFVQGGQEDCRDRSDGETVLLPSVATARPSDIAATEMAALFLAIVVPHPTACRHCSGHSNQSPTRRTSARC